MHYFIILDNETGGLKYQEHPITEFSGSVLDPKDFQVVDQYHTFVKPYNNLIVTPQALKASQVSMHDINAGITSLIFVRKLIEFFQKWTKNKKEKPILVGHNMTFDIEFLEYVFAFHNKNLYDYVDRMFECTMRMMKNAEYKGDLKNKNKYNLTACCERRGIVLKSAHGASADVEATKRLFISLVNDLRNGGNGGMVGTAVASTEKRIKLRKHFQF